MKWLVPNIPSVVGAGAMRKRRWTALEEYARSGPSLHGVENQLTELVAEIVNSWGYDMPGDTGSATRLVADLGFQSVDLVMLMLAIEAHWDVSGIPFEQLLLVDGSRYLDELSIGDLSRFLAEELGRLTAVPSPASDGS
jgi:acyl carrier protein